MDESPLAALIRWEASGAEWGSRRLDDVEFVVELRTCSGELVEEIRSSDPELVRYLSARPRSGLPATRPS